MMKTTILVSCAFGLEKLVKYELLDLGINDFKVSDGKIEFEGDISDVCRCNMYLRTVNRVFVKLAEFKALSFDDLFEGVKKIDWEKYLSKESEFPVSKVSSIKSELFAKSSIQSIAKKAIVEKMKTIYGIAKFPENAEKVSIHVHLKDNIASVLIDTSGESLNKRGYREKGNLAPIKETLASALVKIACRFPEKEVILDPLCGTGTILIEAARLAKNIAPGINREFASENFKWIDSKFWKTERENAKKAINNDAKFKFYGSDIDEKAIKIAKENAKKAMVDEHIEFKVLDFRDISPMSEKGIIICNPPYGERLLDEEEVFNLYQDMGDKFFEDFPKWDYYILSSNLSVERAFDAKSDKNRKLYNGKLLCYLYQYFNRK